MFSFTRSLDSPLYSLLESSLTRVILAFVLSSMSLHSWDVISSRLLLTDTMESTRQQIPFSFGDNTVRDHRLDVYDSQMLLQQPDS